MGRQPTSTSRRPWYYPAVRSMTGFGSGQASDGDLRVTVEVRAVNHRFLDVKVRGAVAPAVEDVVVGKIRERLERGAVTATVVIERPGAAGGARIDEAAAAQAHAQLAAVAHRLHLAAPTLAEVVAVPGVIVVGDPGAGDASDLAPTVAAATTAAVTALCTRRAEEGQALAAELTARAGALTVLVEELTAAAAEVGPTLAGRLRERLDRLLAPGTIAPDRLAQEVAILVERADITEELVRARAHLAAIAAALGEAGPVGRRLDFLCQELGREVNTAGAKSATPAISAYVVQAKAELEKMRERVQNVE
ncbi:MAG: YicC/YloC family endoribonuclease [Kofleriaceae bacterium]